MCLITEHARLKKRVAELEAQLGINMPPPPSGGGAITGANLMNLLNPYGINLSGGSGDYEYFLMPRAAGQHFLDWYRDANSYSLDEYDCEDFAWCLRAAAIRWMKGRYVWGYIEAEGIDKYIFPNHGFNFIVFDNLKIYYCDELGIAAPEDEFMEAYQVKCYMAKA